MSALVDRQTAIELIHTLYPSEPFMRANRERWQEKYKPYIECEKALEQLPPAQPEVTEEAVKDYCHKRCLTVLTNEYFHYLISAPPAVPQWIPCSERLPEVSGAYLVTGKMKYSFEKNWEYFTDIGYTCGEDIDEFWHTCNDWDEGQEIQIIAWMPIPVPWKGEEK